MRLANFVVRLGSRSWGVVAPQLLRKSVRLLGSAILASSAGCADGPVGPEWDDSPLRTDSLVYHLSKTNWAYDATASVTYTNTRNSPVYFERCMPDSSGPVYQLQRAVDRDLESVVGEGAWACGGGVPTGVVEPGQTLEFQVWVGSSLSPYANPSILHEERIGLYLIMLILFDHPTTNDSNDRPLSDDERRSNVFEIKFGSSS